MVTVKTEGKHAGEFIAWELPGNASRSLGIVKQGQNLVAGQVVQKDGTGDLVAFTGAVDSNDQLITQAAGVLFDNVDASASGANADVPGQPYLDWTAVLKLSELTFPVEDSLDNVSQQQVAIDSLALLGIKVR